MNNKKNMNKEQKKLEKMNKTKNMNYEQEKQENMSNEHGKTRKI